MSEIIKGIIPPISTPVNSAQNPDRKAIKKLVKGVIKAGVHGIFVMGSMGGYGFFDDKQREMVINIVIEEVNGKIPVLVGISDTGTKRVLNNLEIAEKNGADAVVACPSFYAPPTQEHIKKYYSEIARQSKIPVYLYNLPAACGVSIDLTTVKELSKVKNILGIKDSSANFDYFLDLIRIFGDRNNFGIYAGDEKCIAQSLISGADGSVVGTADIAPEMAMEIYRAVKNKKYDLAISLQKKWTDLWQIHTKGDVFGVHNYALRLRGIGDGYVMSPCNVLEDEKAKREVREIMKKVNLI